jgi:flavin reductase (DIM6/NTAB) family NADH-FMN oxidoreductase RutF
MSSHWQAIDQVVRLIDREVWIVTAAGHGDRRGGLCATWVSMASIDAERPVVVAGLAANHYTAELVEESGAFALHLCRGDQATLALSFALGSGRERDKLVGLALQSRTSTSPLLADCLAWLECRVFARYDGGDRLYYWADVLAGERVAQGVPLREQQLIAAASEEQKRQLKADRERDIQVQRPLHEAWRSANLFRLQPHPKG